MKKITKADKKQRNARIRSLVSKVHVLIAVVAIIRKLVARKLGNPHGTPPYCGEQGKHMHISLHNDIFVDWS